MMSTWTAYHLNLGTVIVGLLDQDKAKEILQVPEEYPDSVPLRSCLVEREEDLASEVHLLCQRPARTLARSFSNGQGSGLPSERPNVINKEVPRARSCKRITLSRKKAPYDCCCAEH